MSGSAIGDGGGSRKVSSETFLEPEEQQEKGNIMPARGITQKSLDQVGNKFNRLLCESVVWDEDSRTAIGHFKCDCGKHVIAPLAAVRFGNTKSCGCLASDVLRARSYKHGACGSKIYDIWAAMIARCYNPNNARYSDYGGRGITVSDSWKMFENFYSDMGDRPDGLSLDRLDNSKGYSRENCAWAPIYLQNTNKRNNRYLVAFGISLPITWWGGLIEMGSSQLNKALKKHHLEDIIYARVGGSAVEYLCQH